MALVGYEGSSQDKGSMIDREWLQRIQDYFADVSGLFLFALDDQGRQITDISGRDMRETNRIAELINQRQVDELFRRVMQTRLEEQIIENTEFSNMKLAAVSIKSGNTAVFCFMVCAVYYEPDGESAIFNIRSVVDENIFYGGLDFLREICNRVFANALLLETARQESEALKSSEQTLEKALKQSEALTQIVQLLDSEEPFADICDEIAKISAKTVGISHTYIASPNRDSESVDVIVRYRSENANPVIERVNRKELLGYMDVIGDKPMVVSSRTEIDYDFRLWLGSIGVIGFVALPIFTGRPRRRLSMYIVFADNDPTRLWSREDVKFFGDVAKVLQSIYDRRANKASLSSSYNSLQVILDNVGSCVFVKDAQGSEILFRNRAMNETFKDEIKTGVLTELLKKAEEKAAGMLPSPFFEMEYEEKGRTYQVHSARMDWVNGRPAVMYSLFEMAEKKPEPEATVTSTSVTETKTTETGAAPKPEKVPQEQTSLRSALSVTVTEIEPEPAPEPVPEAKPEMEILYEPVIDIIKGSICVGAEALARDPAQGSDRELLLTACRSLKKWNDSGRPYLKLYIGLNNITKEIVEEVLSETGVIPGNLTIELSESFVIENRDKTQGLLSEIRGLGCRTGIFNFGSGKLLLESVKDLPVDVIGLSESVAKDLAANSYAESFIRMTGMLADYMKLTICLTGIDSREGFEKLNGMNIRFVQGKYFDGAMSKEAFEREYM
ncbi:MAG: EAL domain-containing protein [Lachnospiraceae bacterium]|nr:EAL domain-containing protein [Lachnospiraceae bacterium]